MTVRLRVLIFLLCLLGLSAPAAAQDTPNEAAQTAWRMLDYLAVDYGGAVSGGKVISASEYAEMVEFSGTVKQRLGALPDKPAKAGLIAEADQLSAAIGRKAPETEVARRAHALAAGILKAYPTPLAPNLPPDLKRGEQLYAERCATCHGVTGKADGPAAKGMDPPPIAFADASRARQRSVFGLYQVITQGLDGTPMVSFADLPSQDRWALAFYAGRFAFTDAQAKQGEALWKSDAGLRARYPDLTALTQGAPSDLAKAIGENKAMAVTAYLRRHPEMVTRTAGAGPISIVRMRLAESLAAYRKGDRKAAGDKALSAYLDGFEPVEPTLRARNGQLMTRIEAAMGQLRSAINNGAPVAEVEGRAAHIAGLLDAAERALAPANASAGAAFAGAFTILLREGLEALLIVVAMIAFLRKAERTEVLPYVHAGWVAALVAGGMTWLAATFLISISGASRELTEGLGSLFAAAILISVGVWMHGKSQAGAWQAYVREHLSRALSKQSAWFLFLLAFVVVYREVFETILFYAALWSQGGGVPVLAGAGSAIGVLAVIAWALLGYSKRLPISTFFRYSSFLIAVLAVVLAGKGVAALQEAGWIDVHTAPVPRIEILGLYPTWEGVALQVLVALVLTAGIWWSERKPKPVEA